MKSIAEVRAKFRASFDTKPLEPIGRLRRDMALILGRKYCDPAGDNPKYHRLVEVTDGITQAEATHLLKQGRQAIQAKALYRLSYAARRRNRKELNDESNLERSGKLSNCQGPSESRISDWFGSFPSPRWLLLAAQLGPLG